MDMHIGTQKNKPFHLPLSNLKKHAIALGASGSGKTVFTKVLIEEALKAGVPSLVFDVQGDLSSLALFGKQETHEKHSLLDGKLLEGKEVLIYTPVSSKGISICLNPLSIPEQQLPKEEAITLIHDTATTLAKLVGYNVNNSKGKYAQAVLYTVLYNAYEHKHQLKQFEDVIDLLRTPNEELKYELGEFLQEEKQLEHLLKQLKFLTIGQKKLLFQFGMPADIGTLLKKNTISVIYLNTLGSQEEKEYFVATLTNKLYQWMLANPSDKIQGLFVLDEIAPFIPAGSEKPVCKPILKLLFKQARKYGVACVIATQNPGDIDYKAFSQFGTWAVGRLSLKQDLKKVSQALKSAHLNFEEILPTLQTGEFLLYAPDQFEDIQQFKTRWLYTEHKTLNEEDVHNVMKTTTPYKLVQEKENKKQIIKEKKEIITEEQQNPENGQQTTEHRKQETEHRTQNPENKTPNTGNRTQNTATFYVQGKEREEIEKKALQLRKKALFGGKKQELLELQQEYIPLIVTQITQTKHYLFGLIKQHKTYQLVFDAKEGDLITKHYRRKELKTLLNLSEKELVIAAKLHVGDDDYYGQEELHIELGYPKQTITKTLQKLQKQHIIGHQIVGEHKRWIGTFDFKHPSLKKLHTPLVLSPGAERTTTTINIEQLRQFIQHWFDAHLTGTKIAWYPIWNATLSKGRGTKKVRFDGVSGKKL